MNPLTRLQSLIRCARAITELANEKLKAEKQLEAFSSQLVCLAIWKQALHICYDWAAAATGGSPSSDVIISDEALNSSAKWYITVERRGAEAQSGLVKDLYRNQINNVSNKQLSYA